MFYEKTTIDRIRSEILFWAEINNNLGDLFYG